MGLIDDCQLFFDTKDLYAVLAVDRSASTAEIKKSYRRLSLKHHPDRHESDSRSKEQMTRTFQTLSKVHFILSDSEKRAFYDSTGIVDDEGGLDGEADWNDYFRALFPKVTKKGLSLFSLIPFADFFLFVFRFGIFYGEVPGLGRGAGRFEEVLREV